MVFESEVTHEAKRALCKGQHWRDVPCVELSCCPQNSPITTQSHDIVNLALVCIRKYCVEVLYETHTFSNFSMLKNFLLEISWENYFDANVQFMFVVLYEL